VDALSRLGLTSHPHRRNPIHPASLASDRHGDTPMTLLIYYVVITTVMTCISIAIGLAVEQVAAWLSMPLFLVLFFSSLWAAWVAAVKITEPRTRTAPNVGATSDQRV
jgi:uncharacterized membrane protein YphA (DoxX/SURF4 family)